MLELNFIRILNCLSLAGNFLDSKSSKVSSSIYGKSGAVNTQSSAKNSDNANALVPKGKKNYMDEAPCTQASSTSTGSFSIAMEKDRRGSVNEGSYPKDSSYASMSNVSGGSSINGAEPRSIVSDVKNVSLTDKSGNSTVLSARKMNSPAQYKPEKWMLPDKVGEGGLTQLNLAIVS